MVGALDLLRSIYKNGINKNIRPFFVVFYEKQKNIYSEWKELLKKI